MHTNNPAFNRFQVMINSHLAEGFVLMQPMPETEKDGFIAVLSKYDENNNLKSQRIVKEYDDEPSFDALWARAIYECNSCLKDWHLCDLTAGGNCPICDDFAWIPF